MFGINGNNDGNSGPVIAPGSSDTPGGDVGSVPVAAAPADVPSAPPIMSMPTPADPADYNATPEFSTPTDSPADAAGAPPVAPPSMTPVDDIPSAVTPPELATEDVILNDIATPQPASHPASPAHPSHAAHKDDDAVPSDDDLMELKQEALQSLSPLVDELDQTPEEKFKTTMMMLQASDNPSLVRKAYESANQIGDEKVRAQALLDVVNEINYFTQKGKGEEPKDS